MMWVWDYVYLLTIITWPWVVHIALCYVVIGICMWLLGVL